MKADKKAIFTAASQAAKAADYLGNLKSREQRPLRRLMPYVRLLDLPIPSPCRLWLRLPRSAILLVVIEKESFGSWL